MIRKVRLERNLTQEELGKLVKVSFQTSAIIIYSAWHLFIRTVVNIPSVDVAKRVFNYLPLCEKSF